MHDDNRPDFTTIIFIICALVLIAVLVIICARNPGGGAVLSMAVYTRSSRAKLVRAKRRPRCIGCLPLMALSAAQVLCILGKLIGAVALPWLGVLLPLLVALFAVLLFAPAGRD
jgi:hypothetical protein